MGLVINAGGLAALGARSTVTALILLKINFQEREAGEETEEGAYRTDGVAIGAATYPRQHGQHYQCHGSYDEGGKAAKPYFCPIESVAVIVLGYGGETIVCPLIQRAQQVHHNAPKTAVRCQQGYEGA